MSTIVIINSGIKYGGMPLWIGIPLAILMLGTLVYVLVKYPPLEDVMRWFKKLLDRWAAFVGRDGTDM